MAFNVQEFSSNVYSSTDWLSDDGLKAKHVIQVLNIAYTCLFFFFIMFALLFNNVQILSI